MRKPASARSELRRLMQEWPVVMRRASDARAQDFAFSIWKQSGEERWQPTLRQLRMMRRMVRDLCAQPADEIELMED